MTETSTDRALLAIDGAIATITLNRPAAYNSIDLSIAKKLEELAAEVERSGEIKVLVIEGAGRLDLGGEFFKPPGDGEIDRIVGRRAIERNSCDRAIDGQQCRIGRSSCHYETPRCRTG